MSSASELGFSAPAVGNDPTIAEVLQAVRVLSANMDVRLDRIEKDLGQVKKEVGDLSDRVERQERRLASIESFPLPPIKQPARLYATESHSVSLPRRVRLGYAG